MGFPAELITDQKIGLRDACFVMHDELSPSQLSRQLANAANGVNSLGFRIGWLELLITGSRYRLDTLVSEKIRQNEKQTGEWPDSDLYQQIYRQMFESYDLFGPENLTETLRYQYERETREGNLNRAPFPSSRSKHYNNIRTQMSHVSSYARALSIRFPGHSIGSVMPRNIQGVWIHKV